MAIKINNTTVITDSRKGKFTQVTTKSVSIEQLLTMTGTRVGETVFCVDLDNGKGALVTWTGSEWNLPAPIVNGGQSWATNGWKYHLFTAPGILNSTLPGSGEVAVLAGGGGGGAGRIGGGGGAGGFRIASVNWDIGTTPVTVGLGGPGGVQWPGYGPEPRGPGSLDPDGFRINDAWGNQGKPSSFAGITSTGGGAGCRQNAGTGVKSGGSGSGGTSWAIGAGVGNSPPTTPPQGNNGGSIPGSFPGNENNFVGAGGGGWGGEGETVPQQNNQNGRGGLGIAVTDFGPLSASGESWVIPSGVTIGPSVPLGFAGGGSGYGGTFPNRPQGDNVSPLGIGGGGNGSYGQPQTTKNAKSYGAGGGGGGFRDTTNVSGGAGYPGFVLVRYRTS